MSCNTQIVRKISVGNASDIRTKFTFTKNSIPYLTSCNNVFIALFANNQKTAFVKFSYKPATGFKPFTYKTGTDEANGIAYILVESEDLLKAITGIVRAEINIQIADISIVDGNFDTNQVFNIYELI